MDVVTAGVERISESPIFFSNSRNKWAMSSTSPCVEFIRGMDVCSLIQPDAVEKSALTAEILAQ